MSLELKLSPNPAENQKTERDRVPLAGSLMDERVTMLATGTTSVAYGNITSGVDGDVLPISRAELQAHLSAVFYLVEAREEGHTGRVTLLTLETARVSPP